jgi:N-acetyl-alpha-D-glucosaminyl L-malate synthase BshA
VVAIFHRLSEDRPLRLLLVGEGPELARAEQLCRQLGIEDRVEFLGTVGNIEEVLAHADVFLLPSETESFGLAALEALACEVPVVASRIGGVPEVVEDGVSGFLRPVGDIDGMTAAVGELLTNSDKRREMGRAGRRLAAERFSQDDIVARYRALYQEVLATDPAPGLAFTGKR